MTDNNTPERYVLVPRDEAQKLLDDLNARIEDAVSDSVPLFPGIAALHAALSASPSSGAAIPVDVVLEVVRDRRDNGGGSASYRQACNHIIEAVQLLAAKPTTPTEGQREAERIERATRVFSNWVANDHYPLDADKQVILSAMLAFADEEAARLREALEAWQWFSGQRRLSLQFYSPWYCDDDDQAEEWRVDRESGPINDREWETLGRGETALAAVLAARTALEGSTSGSEGE